MTSFITPSSLSNLPSASVAVCAHDAGAASHLSAWLTPYQRQIRPCLAGPAQKIFESQLKPFSQYSLENSISGASLLISGTGWSSSLEHNSRVLAREYGIPIVAVVDHWVNYRSRFNFGGKEVLPDQLWVADMDAKALALRDLPEVPVLQLKNQWLSELTKTVSTLRLCSSRRPARRLIYFLEPIRSLWTGGPWDNEKGEIQGLRYWHQQLPLLVENGWIEPIQKLDKIYLRPHPSDYYGKYQAIIDEFSQDLPIELDQSNSLAASLAWADITFGCETQALVAALACGLPAFSTIPPWASSCRLPHSSLNHLSQLMHL